MNIDWQLGAMGHGVPGDFGESGDHVQVSDHPVSRDPTANPRVPDPVDSFGPTSQSLANFG